MAQNGYSSEQGGYDCQFVESPHEQLQTKCPVCLCILCDPCIIDCCGYSFCHMCIRTVQETKKPCPLCNGQFLTVLPDKRLHRTLKAMQVYCSHNKSGCDWKGELGMVRDHLNETPSPENKMTGCEYTKVKCDHCSVKMERRVILHHQSDECQERPYSCDYCHDYQSSCEDVTVNHWPMCPSRPITCPNQCGIYPKREYLKRHLARECPMAMVKCEFLHIGCDVFLKREDMQHHLMDGMGAHLLLQSQFYQNQLIKLEDKLEDCEFKIAKLERENETLKSTVTCLQYKNDEACTSANKNKKPILNLPHPLDKACELQRPGPQVSELEELKSLICVAPIQFTIHSVSGLHQGRWLSAPFYTHAQGYMMCLKVYPDGHSTSKGLGLSLYVCIMKGYYDDLLKWPFRGSVTIRLIDQKLGKDHIIHTVTFNEGMSLNFSGRVSDCNVSGGWGILKFVTLNELSSKFLRNDSLLIRVDGVQLL